MFINGSSTSSPKLTNVTFYGNTSKGGGAIYHYGNNGDFSLKLINVTFDGNVANSGGAIYNAGPNSYPLLLNSIAWADSAANGPEFFSDPGTGAVSIYNSIIQNGCSANSCSGTPNVNDPVLGALADNGGFTQTMMPGVGSAAIDAIACGYSTEVPIADQRGAVRPDSLSSGATRCDIGAVEANSVPGDLIFADKFGSSTWDDY
jgi:predicted outer membrane repeat protein